MGRQRKERGRSRQRAGRAPERVQNPGVVRSGLRFTRKTAIYGAGGLIFAGAGFLLLAQGSINLAPVLLLVGFLGFFPLALVK